jgi:hypothetical protein
MIKKGKAFLKLREEIENKLQNNETSIELKDLIELMENISYKEFTKRTSGKDVAQELSDFVNSSYSITEQEFVDTLLSEHKTLQQSVFRLFIQCVEGWAEMYDKGCFDVRNEETCKLSKQIMGVVKDKTIPLI